MCLILGGQGRSLQVGEILEQQKRLYLIFW